MAHSFNKWIITEYQTSKKRNLTGSKTRSGMTGNSESIFSKISIYFELRNSIKDYAASN